MTEGIRHFNGIAYKPTKRTFHKKTNAEKYANHLKKEGCLVRIVKLYHPLRWKVYEHH